MKVYVATKWENRPEASEVMRYLEGRGHEVTYDWTVQEQESAEQAIADINGVLRAERLVILAHQTLPYRGVYVELGAALASCVPVYLVGDGLDLCLFSKHPLVRKLTLPEVLAAF